MLKKAKKKPQKRYTRLLVVVLGVFVFSLVAAFFLTRLQSSCANSISCVNDLTGVYQDGENYGQFQGSVVSVPAKPQQLFATNVVLGEQTGSNKRIEVDLTNQHLYAFEGNNKVYDFLVSTGKWGATPVGNFKFWIKLRYTRMSGGSKALHTFYDLPNVPYTMYFYNDQIPKYRGYGVHGAYWHNNFGYVMSHGCINLAIADAEKLFYWADPAPTGGTTYVKDDVPSTPFIIYGTAPNS